MLFSFAIYKYGNLEPQHLPSSRVLSGWKTWQDKNCQSCHQLYGLGGYLGPDLTNSVTAKGKPYLKTFIQYGTARMPNLKLNETQVEEVIEFLCWVDSSGQSSVPIEAVQHSGNYKIQER